MMKGFGRAHLTVQFIRRKPTAQANGYQMLDQDIQWIFHGTPLFDLAGLHRLARRRNL